MMIWVCCVLVLVSVASGQIVQNRRTLQLSSDSLLTPHDPPTLQPLHPQPAAQDRHYNWIKKLKKQEKHKFKKFKKHFKKCGAFFPYKFKFFKRLDDDDLDTFQIIVPYGYSDEYYPRPEEESSEMMKPPPVAHQAPRQTIYSVKYTSQSTPSTPPEAQYAYLPVYSANSWRPNALGEKYTSAPLQSTPLETQYGYFGNSWRPSGLGEAALRNGTVEGASRSNPRSGMA
ncbi:uncharacterized protein [Tenebrio molitor]|uniref:uncharacterized protein n=1 Tax=Tenebrio molitor TaxID=7067 RepID=UPI003624A2CC